MTYPTASIIGTAWSKDGVLVALVDCPLCNKTHSHGWNEYPNPPGVRLSHCLHYPGPYAITVPEDLDVPAQPEPRRRRPYRATQYFDA